MVNLLLRHDNGTVVVTIPTVGTTTDGCMVAFILLGTKNDHVVLGPTAESAPVTAYEHAESEKPATWAPQPTPIVSGKESTWSLASIETPLTFLTRQWPTPATTAVLWRPGRTYHPPHCRRPWKRPQPVAGRRATRTSPQTVVQCFMCSKPFAKEERFMLVPDTRW